MTPTWRKLRIRCARCGADYTDDHICHDYVRHPSLNAFLRGMQMSMEVEWPSESQGKVMAATALAFMFVNLPDSEQMVANAILEHAGVEGI